MKRWTRPPFPIAAVGKAGRRQLRCAALVTTGSLPLFVFQTSILPFHLTQVTTPPETVALLQEIEEVFTKSAAHLIYYHKVLVLTPG